MSRTIADLSLDFEAHGECFLAHAHAATALVSQSNTRYLKDHSVIRLIDTLSAYNDLSTFATGEIDLQFTCQTLIPSAHYITDRGLIVAYRLHIVYIINIIDIKSQSLLFLEGVEHLEASFKVGVQVVVNLLCFSKFQPLSARLVPLTHIDYWITLRKDI